MYVCFIVFHVYMHIRSSVHLCFKNGRLPDRRTVDANLKSGTIEILHGSSARWSQQQLGRILATAQKVSQIISILYIQICIIYLCIHRSRNIMQYPSISINTFPRWNQLEMIFMTVLFCHRTGTFEVAKCAWRNHQPLSHTSGIAE